MYITINNVIGEKRIDLSYPLRNFDSSKEVTVINMFSDNVQYGIIKPRTIIDSISPGNEKLILCRTYAGRELISVSEGMVAFTHFVNDDGVMTNNLVGITEMIFNLNDLDNSDNLDLTMSYSLIMLLLMKILHVLNPTSHSTRNLKMEILSLIP